MMTIDEVAMLSCDTSGCPTPSEPTDWDPSTPLPSGWTADGYDHLCPVHSKQRPPEHAKGLPAVCPDCGRNSSYRWCGGKPLPSKVPDLREAALAVWKWNDEQADCAYCTVSDFEDGHSEFCPYLALGKALGMQGGEG